MVKRLMSLTLLVLLVITVYRVPIFRETYGSEAPAESLNELNLVDAYPGKHFRSPVEFVPGGEQEDFIVEQCGVVWSLPKLATEKAPSPLLDISDRVTCGGERGLLGMALSPDFSSSGVVYVHYSLKGTGATTLSRIVIGNRNAGPSHFEEQVLLSVPQPYSNHNGGKLTFGPDGYLYLGLGDGGSGGDPQGNGQKRTTFLGKILRVDVSNRSRGKYEIPTDNPFKAGLSGALPEIYAYGLRNPWKFSFDRQTRDLWVGDVGQNTREEIDIVKRGGNYGWNRMEGTFCFEPRSQCDKSGVELPVFDYGRSLGGSVTGGYVYRGTEIPSLFGDYLFSDFLSGTIFALHRNADTIGVRILARTQYSVSSFGEDSTGELYVLHYGTGDAEDGTVFRIIRKKENI